MKRRKNPVYSRSSKSSRAQLLSSRGPNKRILPQHFKFSLILRPASKSRISSLNDTLNCHQTVSGHSNCNDLWSRANLGAAWRVLWPPHVTSIPMPQGQWLRIQAIIQWNSMLHNMFPLIDVHKCSFKPRVNVSCSVSKVLHWLIVLRSHGEPWWVVLIGRKDTVCFNQSHEKSATRSVSEAKEEIQTFKTFKCFHSSNFLDSSISCPSIPKTAVTVRCPQLTWPYWTLTGKS